MNRPIKLSLAIALALGSPAALALGLGSIDVKSGLNEPLVAEIPILEGGEGEADGLKANLAKAEDFTRVGLDVRGVAVPLEFTISRDKAGRPIIEVTSADPVREPFLNFLLEVSWGKGRLLREYSVLLDPPVVAPAVIDGKTVVETVAEAPPAPPEPLEALPSEPVATVEPTPSEPVAEVPPPAEPVVEEPAPVEPPPAEPVAEIPPPPSEPVTEAPPPAEPVAEIPPEPAPEAPVETYTETPSAPPSAPGEYGPVAGGETLWEIASATRPGDAVSVHQMMIALLRTNPDAFANGNINELKRGAVLRVPTLDEAQAIAQREAIAEVNAQVESWRQARPNATLVTDNAYAATTGSPSTSSSTTESRLELVPPRAGAEGSGADRPGIAGGTDTSSTLRTDLARTQEQLASREQEAGELRSRVQELERLKSQNDRLVELKDTEIAELQRKLADAERVAEQARAEANAAQQAAATAPVETAPLPTPVTSEPIATTPDTTTTEPVATEPAPQTDTSALATTEPSTTETTPTEPVTTEPAPQTDTSTALTAEPAPDTGTTTAEVTPVPETAPSTTEPVAETPAEQPPLPWYRNMMVIGGGAAASALLVLVGIVMLLRRKKAPEPAPVERGSVADQFSGGVFGGSRGASDGMTGDEEHALLERLAADPTDLGSHLELLALYHAQSDVDKFEAAASAMYAQVIDTDCDEWQAAVNMGRELIPDSPMFQPAQEYPSAAGATDEFDFSALEPKPNNDFAMPDALDLDFGGNTPTPSPSSTSSVASADDFDFSLEAPPAAPPPAQDAKLKVREPETFRTQEFKVPDFAPPAAKPAAPAPAPAPAADAGFFDGEDAVGTKLDLARAYLDMGDPDGARSMLQEVIAEGTDAQKTEAKRLLSEIG